MDTLWYMCANEMEGDDVTTCFLTKMNKLAQRFASLTKCSTPLICTRMDATDTFHILEFGEPMVACYRGNHYAAWNGMTLLVEHEDVWYITSLSMFHDRMMFWIQLHNRFPYICSGWQSTPNASLREVLKKQNKPHVEIIRADGMKLFRLQSCLRTEQFILKYPHQHKLRALLYSNEKVSNIGKRGRDHLEFMQRKRMRIKGEKKDKDDDDDDEYDDLNPKIEFSADFTSFLLELDRSIATL
jgi:hypothetical protein